MYDKSKKSWSQRLKIHKNEKSQETKGSNTTSTTATATHNSQAPTAVIATTASKTPYTLEAHNVNSSSGNSSSSSSRASIQQYQLAPAPIMHLPSISDYHASGAGQSYEYMPNPVSRSMKYAEPWIYGTVRGIPARPASIYHPAYAHYGAPPHATTIFAAPTTDLAAGPTATALAVVLCSCHEYLSGTKGRTLKKPSICKKCKGTRLPLHSIGGTVRLPTNLPSPKLRPVGAASTVRVVSANKKMRPSILDPQKDPYDLMRRTRLISPEPGNIAFMGATSSGKVPSKEKSRQRGKSISPVRGRSRTRHHNILTSNMTTKDGSKTLESLDDDWLTESEDLAHTASSSALSSSSRKSILRCNVNPYDLISINNQSAGHISSVIQDSKEAANKANRKQKFKFSQNEFMPPNNDFNVHDAALTEDEPPFIQKATTKERVDVSKADNNKKSIEEDPPPNTPPQNKKPNYNNVQAIAGQRISLGEEQKAPKSLLQQTSDGTTTYESFAVDSEPQMSSKETEKSTKIRPDSLQVPLAEPKRPHRAAKQQSLTNEPKESLNGKDIAEEEEEPTVTVTVTPTYNIKSILKRPISKNSDNFELEKIDSASKNPSTPLTPSKQRDTDNNSKNGTPTNSRRNNITISSSTSNSQFYIPLPQIRKKVQFLVEDAEHTGSEDPDDEDSSYDNCSLSSVILEDDLKANYEYYNKKRNPKKELNTNEHHKKTFDDSETEVITYDEQFIQAMLLEKLQLDSELVTKKYTSNQEQNDDEALAIITNNIKTDYDDVVANGGQNDSQYSTQPEENQSELESQGEKDDKQYISENLGKATTALQLTKTTTIAPAANEQKFQNPSATTALNSQSSTNNKLSCDSALLQSAKHNDIMSWKSNDTDDYKGLPCINNNDDDKEKIIIVTGFKDCDDGNINVSTNSDTDNGPHIKKYDESGGGGGCDGNGDGDGDDDTNADGDGNDAVDDQHLIGIVHFDEGKEGDDDGDGCPHVRKPPACHRNDNNHSHDDDDVVANDVVNLSTPLSPVSKVQHNGAKKSTISDYDDDAKTVQRQQQLQQQKFTKKMKKDMQALAALADSGSNVNSASSSITSSSGIKNLKIPTKETQSRNPIRRSQSERQPTTAATNKRTSLTYHNGNISYYKNNSNNNNKKKKDQQLNHDSAPVDNGGNNENIIPNSRNSFKNIENIPNIINGTTTVDCTTLEDTVKRNMMAKGTASNTSLHFHDTMALRNRYNRNDARDLFSMALLERPREPPPPPPSLMAQSSPPPIQSASTTLKVKNATTSQLPKDVNFNQAIESATTATDATETFQPQHQHTKNGLENKQQQQQQQHLEQKLIIGHELKLTNNLTFCKEIKESNLIEQKTRQQKLDSNIEILTELKNSATSATVLPSMPPSTFTSSSPLSMSKVEQNMLPTKTAGGNSLDLQQEKPQRTVVRVAPFNKSFSEVHRLKITHTDNNDIYPPQSPLITNTSSTINSTPSSPFSNSSHYSVTDLSTLNVSNEYGQKKTSILINGDDCYSTMNLSCDDSCTPLYQSSVVVNDGSTKADKDLEGMRVINAYNTITINVSSPRSSEDELILQHNKLNNLLKRQSKSSSATGSIRAIIPIRGTIDINLQRSASSTSSTSTCSITSSCSSTSSSSSANTSKKQKTLIRLDYEKEKSLATESMISSTKINGQLLEEKESEEWLPHETELLKILRNPVEAVKRNLVPHICKLRETDTQKDVKRSKKMNERHSDIFSADSPTNSPINKTSESTTFIAKLLEDPMLQQVAEGLEIDTVAELIENSLKRLQESRCLLDMTGTKDNSDMNRLIDVSLRRIQEERSSSNKESSANQNLLNVPTKDEERLSNRGSISSANSFTSAHNYELFDFDANESDCYQSCSSDINSMMEEETSSPETKTKFYQMLVDATLQEIELSTNIEDLTNDEHQYESIRHNIDPIYEEISDMPPPLPLTSPPLNDPDLDKKSARSIFEGASKYDILSYLVDAKERGLVKEEPFDCQHNISNPIIMEEESADTLSDLGKLNKLKRIDTISSRSSIMSDSSDDNQSTMSSLSPPTSNNFVLLRNKHATSDIERNDSGVGSETSKSSRSKFLNTPTPSPLSPSNSITSSSSAIHQQPIPRSSPIHLCEDCDGTVETQIGDNGHIFAPLVCRKCAKKRIERKEIITEVVETEEKYGRDLQIILEEFCHPMLVAGLLTQEQLSAIFLNTEELLENNQTLAERMRDALDIALEQGDDDLLTVNIGKIILDSTQMLHAFESYCVRQAGASLLLANLEKEKELLRIFLKVSQMENAVLRRMNLNSFLMVPVQRVTKYPLLLARLYKVTPAHLEGRDQLKQAQEKIELHLNHINQEAKDVPTKLWRRISSSSPSRRASCEIDMINIKLRKMAVDVLEWNHDEVRFVMEGKLLYTQPTDSNWKKARTIKLTTVNALLVTNGKPSTNYKADKVMSDKLNFPKHTGIREASLLVVKEKCGRYALIREPLYLDRCVVCSEADWDEYFEIQEISSKDTFIFKAEDNVRTKQWYTQLQYHSQGMGAWRKRRNALANIMINGMLTRS